MDGIRPAMIISVLIRDCSIWTTFHRKAIRVLFMHLGFHSSWSWRGDFYMRMPPRRRWWKKNPRGLPSKEFSPMGLKKLLTTEMPTISKSTPYWRALKVCSLLFLLPEVILAVALLFNQVSLTDFWQISLGLLVLWPLAPIVLRMKARALFVVIAVVSAILFIAFVLLNVSKKDIQKQEASHVSSIQ